MFLDDKKCIRQAILDQRARLIPEEIRMKSYAIYLNLIHLNEFVNAGFIMAYLDARNEVRTGEIIEYAWAQGKRVAVPVCVPKTKNLIAAEIKGFEELEEGFYGIKQPKDTYMRPVEPAQLELIIVPAVAYDRRGYRIGYGAGYYDRFLADLKGKIPLIGIAFEFQILEQIYAAPWDIPVDMIITERDVIRCAAINSKGVNY